MKYVLILLLFTSTASHATGWSQFATPTQVDVVLSSGFMIHGNFGNAGGCSIADRIYVLATHPQYNEIYSAVLTAFTSEKQIRIYINTCDAVLWYSPLSTTYNIMDPNSVLNIRN